MLAGFIFTALTFFLFLLGGTPPSRKYVIDITALGARTRIRAPKVEATPSPPIGRLFLSRLNKEDNTPEKRSQGGAGGGGAIDTDDMEVE
jgi:hypothetical protein